MDCRGGSARRVGYITSASATQPDIVLDADPPHTSGMKFVVLTCLAAVAAAAPQFLEPKPVAILRDDRQDNGNGNFNYAFEAENGIAVDAVGTQGSQGQSNIQGTFRFPLPDGTIAEVRYIANEFGFQPESSLLPTAFPLPVHAVEQIRVAQEQRRRGITFDEAGRKQSR